MLNTFFLVYILVLSTAIVAPTYHFYIRKKVDALGKNLGKQSQDQYSILKKYSGFGWIGYSALPLWKTGDIKIDEFPKNLQGEVKKIKVHIIIFSIILNLFFIILALLAFYDIFL